jgi:hypothetical protein
MEIKGLRRRAFGVCGDGSEVAGPRNTAISGGI